MNNLTLCFERATGIIGKAINECSGRDGYCHVALRFSDGRMFASDDGIGTAWHATDYHPGAWDFIAVPITDEQEVAVQAWCNDHVGLPYSWVGDFAFLLPLPADRKGVFCSEVAVQAIQSIGLLGSVDAAKVSPNALWLIARAMGWAIAK